MSDEELPEQPETAADENLHWRRVHKITPLLETWQVLAAILGFIALQNVDMLMELFQEYDGHWSALRIIVGVAGSLALIALLAGGYSMLAWRARAYAITEDSVHEKKGVLLRQHRSARLTRVQTVDVINPLLGRFFGLGKLKIETAGGGDSRLEIGFLKDAELQSVRNEILARAAGVHGTAAPETQAPADSEQSGSESIDAGSSKLNFQAAPEQILYQVTPATLIGGLLRSVSFIFFILTVVGLLAAVIGTFAGLFGQETRAAGFAPLFGMLPALLGWGAWAWNRFAGEFNFTAASSPDGLRLRKGLLETRSQTLPPGRVHAVQFSQPLLWRRRDWWRVAVVIAGYGVESSDVQNMQFDTILLPVGDRETAKRALWLVMPDLGVADPDALLDTLFDGSGPADGLICAVPNSRWFNWFTWKRKAVASTETGFFVRDGRFNRLVSVAPHERSQSHTLYQGPVGKALNTATVRLDLVPGSFGVAINGLDPEQAASLWWEESRRGRRRREQEGPEAWLARCDSLSIPARGQV